MTPEIKDKKDKYLLISSLKVITRNWMQNGGPSIDELGSKLKAWRKSLSKAEATFTV